MQWLKVELVFFLQVLGFNLMESGLFSVLPWLTMALSANVGGWIADSLVSRGVSVTLVRKVGHLSVSLIYVWNTCMPEFLFPNHWELWEQEWGFWEHDWVLWEQNWELSTHFTILCTMGLN
jgi:hypothetical protein